MEEPKTKKKRVFPTLNSSKINAGAVCSGWACLASWKGCIYVWPAQVTPTSSSSPAPSTKQQQKLLDAPKKCVTLYHPALVSISDDSDPPLIALTPASPDAVYVYACNPSEGGLVVWKVSRDDVERAQTMPLRALAFAHTALPLEREVEEDEAASMVGELEEHPTCLTVINRHMVVLGTSKGSLLCCTQSTIPLALHSQRMLKSVPNRRSLAARLIFGSGEGDDSAPKDDSKIAFALPLPAHEEGCTELLTLSIWGSIWHWKIRAAVATSHRVTTAATCLTTIATLFMESLPNTSLTHVEILQAKSAENLMHVLVRITEDSEIRLYWVRIHVERDGPNVCLDWMDCQWLNRFPAPQDIEVMGLVLSVDKMVYAAFHQGSGGITSSVIIMSLGDLEDSHSGDRRSTTILEVDLPMKEIPALLPGTFVNDVVTHGVCFFARSGLGIRVRVLPLATTAAALSPLAVRRAHPAAVLKLTNHLRGAFWQAHQCQSSMSSGALAVPPSVVEASPIDLEEAVLAIAMQIHTRRGIDGIGWFFVANDFEVNALELHLALITWLRQGGIYRSLSKHGKWRLMAFGQEIAAFLDLVPPTLVPNSTVWEQQQMSRLSLSQVAVWLKETLETTLHGAMDHYQLWCGWFSTALATALAYRKERAGVTYDITSAEQPPTVGSSSGCDSQETGSLGVPVWTSHPVLQEIFGTLLQHWKSNPKQRSLLPPQTVEIIARAALDSFADSANSLSSDIAIGKYAEIKAMVIPFVRTLHPLVPQMWSAQTGGHYDDNLAFELSIRHEYYEGICALALDHENKADANNFRLGPLLKSVEYCQSTDFQSGFTFAQFVLQWHTDRGLFGHTILYGRLCPERDLNHILQSDERLRPYRWIQSVHKGDYSSAATTLMGKPDKFAVSTLAETKWAYCLAKLSNHVVLKESQSQQAQAEKREVKINNTLELVGVQRELLGSCGQSAQHLWSANRLLSRALENTEQSMATGRRDQAETVSKNCYLGLLVCATLEETATKQRLAAQVWAKALGGEWETLWTEWIRNEKDLSREALARAILETSMFGGLLTDCAVEKSLRSVAYCRSMNHEIFQYLGLSLDRDLDSLCRLLSGAKKIVEANTGEE